MKALPNPRLKIRPCPQGKCAWCNWQGRLWEIEHDGEGR
jgi:hypothetical protein